MDYRKRYRQSAFTIVELLVVIVVIGILAAITIVSYTGISSKASVASVQADLSNASTQLKLYYAEYGVYPATMPINGEGKYCPTNPIDTMYCIKPSTNITYEYTPNNPSNPTGFCLTTIANSISYKVTDTSSPAQGDRTTYGLVLSLDAGNSSSYPGSGTTWTDLSGLGNNGTLINGVGYSGSNGGALTFDGVDDYGTIPYSTNLSLPKFTLGAWAKPNGLQTASASIFSDSYPPNVNYTLYFATNTLNIMGGIYLGGWYNTNTATLTDSAWVYVISTYDGANLSLYVNGGLVGASTVVAINPSASGTPIRIGKRWDQPNYFKGSIGSINLYNRALSSSEITQSFNATKSHYGL